MATATKPMKTVGDVLALLPYFPAERIRVRPMSGTGTIEDALAIKRFEGRICEVIDGVVVEKPMGYYESQVALRLGFFIEEYLTAHDIGTLTGEDGPISVRAGQMRYPDLAFFSWAKFPNRILPRNPILDHVPDLAVEVLSGRNTPGAMERKRRGRGGRSNCCSSCGSRRGGSTRRAAGSRTGWRARHSPR